MSVNVPSGSDDYNSRPAVAINIETLRLQLSGFAARIQSRVSVDTLRPLPVFLGLTGSGFCLAPTAFTPPTKKFDKATPEKIKSRVKLNFAFFLTNYVLLASMTALVVALMHPGMVFFLAIVYGLWSLHAFLLKNQLVLFGIAIHSLLTVQQRFYLLFTTTTVVVVWKCLAPTLIFLSISSVLIVLHAFLRDPKNVQAFDGNGSDEEDLEGGGDNSSGSEVMVERPANTATKRNAK